VRSNCGQNKIPPAAGGEEEEEEVHRNLDAAFRAYAPALTLVPFAGNANVVRMGRQESFRLYWGFGDRGVQVAKESKLTRKAR